MSQQETPYFATNVVSNWASLGFVHSTSASLIGAAAGVLGLTSLSGFLFYILISLFTGLAYTLIKTKSVWPTPYFARGLVDTLLGGLVSNAFGFVLFWTLFYALVHIYN